jgi:hypothetical protein
VDAGHFDLLGMNEPHSGRGEQEICALVGDPNAGHSHPNPERRAQIGLPRFAAKLATLDFERLLTAEILRLLVREDFLREGVNVDGP